MKRPLKRILALLTAVCLTAALTGCGREVQPAGNDRLPALTVQITMGQNLRTCILKRFAERITACQHERDFI